MARAFRFNRLWVQLVAAGAVLVVGTALLISVIGTAVSRRAILDEAEDHIDAVVQERRARVLAALDRYDELVRIQLMPAAGEGAEVDAGRLAWASAAGVFDENGRRIDRRDTSYAPDPTALRAASMSHEPAYGVMRLDNRGRPVLDLVLPLATQRKPAALLAVRLLSERTIEPILTDTSGLGVKGEVFLLDREMTMLTPSRTREHPDPLTHKMPIPPARAALERGRGTMSYESFLGEEVVGAYDYLPRQRWVLVGEMNVAEALQPLRELTLRTVAIAAAAIILLLLLTFRFARSWTRPIVRITRASEQVAGGSYEVRVPERRGGGEVAALGRSFNRMVAALERGRSEIAAAQRRAVQAETMAAIGRLVASIVHEMRNPLSSIKMNLRLLERRCEQGSSEAEHVGLAAGEVARLEAMLDELLAYGKPPEVTTMPVDMVKVARDSIDAVRDAAEDRRITVELTGNDALEAVSDGELVRRALVNLLQNAIDACAEGDSIRVELARAGDRIALAVRDTGRGMPESVRMRLFDPFFTTRDDGVGLGMSNVKKFVEALGGTVEVASREGEGSAVTIELPGESADGDTADRR